MSARTRWISKRIFREIDPYLLERIEKVLGSSIPETYGATIGDQLRVRGEHALANEFLENVDHIGPGKPTPCCVCRMRVSYGVFVNGKNYCNAHGPGW